MKELIKYIWNDHWSGKLMLLIGVPCWFVGSIICLVGIWNSIN